MVNFAELKAKAEKAKDAGVTKMTNTRDRYSSVPTSKSNWDPNWKRPPTAALPTASATGSSGPPSVPLRSRPQADGVASAPTIPFSVRPTDDVSAPSSYVPRPPPTRAPSGYPSSQNRQESPGDTGVVDRIDWAHLSPEDKEAFFGWLDEFFSRYLQIELSSRERRRVPFSAPSPVPPVRRMQNARPPPTVNLQTRPHV